MFRTQQNAFDDVVGKASFAANGPVSLITDGHAAKATDENLTSENWEYILVRQITLPLANEAHAI
jgi:hypothetical protein